MIHTYVKYARQMSVCDCAEAATACLSRVMVNVFVLYNPATENGSEKLNNTRYTSSSACDQNKYFAKMENEQNDMRFGYCWMFGVKRF